MSERLKDGGENTVWEDLKAVEFRGGKLDDARVTEVGKAEHNFSSERRERIEKERQELAEADEAGEAAKKNKYDGWSYNRIVQPCREKIIMEHAAEEDGLAYLNEVFGGDMKETLRIISTVDTDVTINHFHELVKMYDDGDEQKAKQQAIEMVEEGFKPPKKGPIFTYGPKARQNLLDLAKREGVRLSDEMVKFMIGADTLNQDDFILLRDTEYFGQYDFAGAEMMSALLHRDGKRGELKRGVPILRELGVDENKLADEIKDNFDRILPRIVDNIEIFETMGLSVPSIVGKVIEGKLDDGDYAEAFASLGHAKRAGVDISGIVQRLVKDEKNMQKVSVEKYFAILAQAEILKEEGVDVAGMLNRMMYDNMDNYHTVATLITADAELMKLGVAVKPLLVEALNAGDITTIEDIKKLRALGVEVDETAAGELDDLKQRIRVPEYVGKEIKSSTISEEAREEQKQEWSRLIGERDNYSEPYKAFVDEQWQKLDDDERMAAVEKLAESLVTMYGLVMPYEIRKVPQDKLGERTCGQCGRKWIYKDNPIAKHFVDELRRVGIEKQWVMKAEIDLSESRMDDGPRLADTLAHELRHAFQDQQAYLYASGYFEGASAKDSAFRWMPNLAKYYAANLQDGTYCKSDISYQKYREQLVEDEAFKSGALFGVNMVARVSEHLDAKDRARKGWLYRRFQRDARVWRLIRQRLSGLFKGGDTQGDTSVKNGD